MPKHVTVSDTSATFAGAAPVYTGATSATETATSGKLGRFVFGSYNIAATATDSAFVQAQVETGVGTGVYTTVTEARANATLTTATKRGFGFFCPPGFRYRFVKGNAAAVVETFDVYNYVDIG